MGSHELSIDFNQALLLLEMSITIDESTWGNIPGDDTSMCVIFIAVFQLMGFYRVLVAICLQKKTRQTKNECQWEHLWARGNMHVCFLQLCAKNDCCEKTLGTECQ